MFCNLFFLKEFRDHNFSDFWVGTQTAARIEQVAVEIFAGYLRQSFRPRSDGGGDLPPDFDPIITLTLSPKCCASFVRTHPAWPYDERDYYLSKLYQFVLAVLDAKFSVWESSSRADEIGRKVEALLDLVPRELLPPVSQVDWLQFFWQVWRAALTGTLDETVVSFEEGVADILGTTPAQLQKAVEDQGLPARRYGPQPDVETHLRVHEIVSKYSNWKEGSNSMPCARN